MAWDDIAEYVAKPNTPLAIPLEQQFNEPSKVVFLPPYHEWRATHFPIFTLATITHHLFAPPGDSNLSDTDSAISTPRTAPIKPADTIALAEPLPETQLARSSSTASNDEAYSDIQHLMSL